MNRQGRGERQEKRQEKNAGLKIEPRRNDETTLASLFSVVALFRCGSFLFSWRSGLAFWAVLFRFQ